MEIAWRCLPDPAKATGAAIIIAPGGGFIFLGTDTHKVAEWLAARGLAAFALKYRTVQLEGQSEAQLNQSGGARFGDQLNNHALIAEDGKYGLADGIQAIKVVRALFLSFLFFFFQRRLLNRFW